MYQDSLSACEPQNKARNGVSVLFIFITIVFALALFSFSPEDISSFSTDFAGKHYTSNVLGKAGAHVIWWILVTFGLGTHALAFAMVIASLRRLFLHRLIQRPSWDYYLVLLFIPGISSLIVTVWHGTFDNIAKNLNIATLPGGIFGDALVGQNGILLYISNDYGVTIVALLLLAAVLSDMFYYDWLPLAKWLFARNKEKKTTTEPKLLTTSQESSTSSHNRADDDVQTVNIQQPTIQTTPVRTIPTFQPELPLETTPQLPQTPASRQAKPTAHAPEDAQYVLPDLTLLNGSDNDDQTAASAKEIQTNQERLQAVLDSFKVDGSVLCSVPGPQVTLFKIKLSEGVKVERISSIEKNIQLDLCAGNIRILAPIPGERLVGVEVPNQVLKSVTVRNMMEDTVWTNSKHRLPLLLGKNIAGKTICIDLAAAPHLLIAGATGTGKSVCMNLIIMSLLYKHTPETLRFIMVDPKKVEFSIYHNLPHLLAPVITDNAKVALALNWVCQEMDRRYNIFKLFGCRNLDIYNSKTDKDLTLEGPDGKPIPDKMPYIVVIIDELADIMITSKNEVEASLARLAALARAVGIHVILATQRPDVKVITGTIKSNFPVRIAFRTSSAVDSQTIIGGKGAEALLGKGDMLYKPAGVTIERIQGGMALDDERDRIVDFITQNSPAPTFDVDIFTEAQQDANRTQTTAGSSESTDDSSEKSLYEQALEVVLRDRKTSISYIQRRLRIGYNKAASLVEELEQNGIIGPKIGTKDAEILVDPSDYLDTPSTSNDFTEDDASIATDDPVI